MVPRIPGFLSGALYLKVFVWFIRSPGSCLVPQIFRVLSDSSDLLVPVRFLDLQVHVLFLRSFVSCLVPQIFRFLSSSYQSSKNSSFLSVSCQFSFSFLSVSCHLLSGSCHFMSVSCHFLSGSQDPHVLVRILGSRGSSQFPRICRFQCLFLGSLDFCLVPRISRLLSGSLDLQILFGSPGFCLVLGSYRFFLV